MRCTGLNNWRTNAEMYRHHTRRTNTGVQALKQENRHLYRTQQRCTGLDDSRLTQGYTGLNNKGTGLNNEWTNTDMYMTQNNRWVYRSF